MSVQFTPLPKKPGRQLQSKLPTVSSHSALVEQLSAPSWHSSSGAAAARGAAIAREPAVAGALEVAHGHARGFGAAGIGHTVVQVREALVLQRASGARVGVHPAAQLQV